MADKIFHEYALDQRVLNAGLKLLKNRKFVGKFTDRRYINVLAAYRDAVYVDRKDIVLLEDLNNIRTAILECSSISWPAISHENKETVIFTGLNDGIPFGTHTWEVTGLTIFKGEFVINIQRLRSEPKAVDDSLLFDFNFDNILNFTTNFLRDTITLQNVKESSKYIIIVFLTLINVAVELVRLFVVFFHILLLHFPRVMESIMPFLLAVVNGVTKCVGGFYILVAMMWGANRQPPTASKYGALPPSSGGRWTDATTRDSITLRNAKKRAQFFENAQYR